MRVLVLGGTGFLGRLCVLEALDLGHDVTVLNRGTRSPPLPPSVTVIHGDRLAEDGGMSGLEGLSFDTVIDTWSGEASAVRASASALRDRISSYVFVSSVSVHNDGERPNGQWVTEETPLHDAEGIRPISPYIANKLDCEAELRKSGVPTLVARPGVILGPWEVIPGRLPWWLQRLAKGGPTLAPGPKDNKMQFIDGRDLARFLLDGGERKLDTAVIVVAPRAHITMGELLDTGHEITGGRADLMWLEQAKVLRAGVEPWSELPLWLPLTPSGRGPGVYSSEPSYAFSLGLSVRDAKETLVDTWTWMQTGAAKRIPKRLSPEKEEQVLREFFDLPDDSAVVINLNMDFPLLQYGWRTS